MTDDQHEMSAEQYVAMMAEQKGGSKYSNKRVQIDGRVFDSKVEGARYLELKMLEGAGEIDLLECQHRFALRDNTGAVIAHYVADFRYFAKDESGSWFLRIEDVKGVETDVFKLKRRWFESMYGTPITIVRRDEVDVSLADGYEVGL